MAIAFVVTTAETDLVTTLFPDVEYPCADGALFKFRTADANPAIAVLVAFAADAEPGSEEQRAALRLAERLGTWIGRSHVEQMADPEPVADPEDWGAVQVPSPAPKRGRKASAEQEAPVADEVAED
jgi:hypothetical protein